MPKKRARAEDTPLFEMPARPQRIRAPLVAKNPVWTENKARLIAEYLYRFILVTRHGTYLDGFAGPQDPEHPEMWAARQVLEIDPEWLRHFHLFDTDAEQVHRLEELRAQHSGRDIHVYPEDFNTGIVQLLNSRAIGDREATFCLIDQRNFECAWETVERLAAYRDYVEGQQWKIELFYFLPSAWFDRSAKSRKRDTTLEQLREWWGRDGFDALLQMRSPQRAGAMAKRIRELGYRSVTPWPIYKAQRSIRVMYYMIHATDHRRAPDLMSDAYRKAVGPREPADQLVMRLGLPGEPG